jgi:hypothetical protein
MSENDRLRLQAAAVLGRANRPIPGSARDVLLDYRDLRIAAHTLVQTILEEPKHERSLLDRVAAYVHTVMRWRNGDDFEDIDKMAVQESALLESPGARKFWIWVDGRHFTIQIAESLPPATRLKIEYTETGMGGDPAPSR